ncbi:Uma2 family endonuclease [Calothrix sp. UHCC 0171]|uniref:Uma2 family endonuclease n=1 Tax=Calothrix sp. UHCC 0171 TaxID=3110245 RepID=UPI002B20073C|nr:Uma2 family endonuclease [Calothrix sp. UHCC 0171]MEA5569636.1 Uma2 family endonuclease [Calothrix sp. UHCC 0171]
MYEPIPPRPARETLPTMYDLPSEEIGESGLPDEFHRLQANLLSETCQPPNIDTSEKFTPSDLNLYYDPRHTNWYKRPDWYLVVGVAPEWENDLRWSYVVWQEGVRPFLMVELLSPGTEAEDLGETLRDASKPPTKWEVYERILAVPYYVVYDRYTNNLRVFKLNGSRYQAVVLPENLTEKRFWFEELEIGLGLWQGNYQGFPRLWLRWYDHQGWIPTQTERAESERQRAESERQRAEKLAEYLRSQGIDPDNLPI